MDKIEGQIKEGLLNETSLGGFPFYGSDHLRLQKNSRIQTVSFLEGLREKQGLLNVVIEGTPDTTGKVSQGLFLTIPEINNDNLAAVVVGECFFMVDGQIIKFLGGTFNSGSGEKIVLSSLESVQQRVFKDGSSKDAISAFAPISESATIETLGLQLVSGAFDLNKEFCTIDLIAGVADQSFDEVTGINEINTRLEGLEVTLKSDITPVYNTSADWIITSHETGLQVKRDKFGDVSLFGIAQVVHNVGTSQNVTVANLPVGYRPTSPIRVLAVTITDPLSTAASILDDELRYLIINVDGAITLYGWPSDIYYINFGNINFPTL